MAARGGGGVLTLTYLGSPACVSELQRDGRGEGGAGGICPVSGQRPRATSDPRQRHLGRSIKTLAAAGISGFSNILSVYRDRAPLRRNIDAAEVADAALFLLSEAGRAVTGEVLFADAGYHAMGL